MQRVRWQLDLPDQALRTAPDHVIQEAQRLWERLTPELVALLAGKQSFQIVIHGKPGARCKVSVTRHDCAD